MMFIELLGLAAFFLLRVLLVLAGCVSFIFGMLVWKSAIKTAWEPGFVETPLDFTGVLAALVLLVGPFLFAIGLMWIGLRMDPPRIDISTPPVLQENLPAATIHS